MYKKLNQLKNSLQNSINQQMYFKELESETHRFLLDGIKELWKIIGKSKKLIDKNNT